MIEELIQRSPTIQEAYDTSTDAFQAYREEVEAWWLDHQNENIDVESSADTIGFRLALKLARAREILRLVEEPLTITLLNPVYKETGRMQPRSEHEHGEDSVRFKLRELQALEELNPNLTMRFVVIDDECPNGSGKMAEEILRTEYRMEFDLGKYKVLYLKQAIDMPDRDLPPGLTHKSGNNRSVKGGALLFGMRKEIHHSYEGMHILVDNDADLSVHIGQLGLLVGDILNGKDVVAGSRREQDSVALVGGKRNVRGQLFIQIWKHFLPELGSVVTDTNRAFKAFELKALAKILPKIQIYTFPYQIEILQATLSEGFSLGKTGIGYIDSEAASTQSGSAITETYLNQIHQIIDIAKRYNTIDPSDKLMQFFLSISESEWMKIEQSPPKQIQDLV